MFHHDRYVEDLHDVLAVDMRCGYKYANNVLENCARCFDNSVGEFPSKFSYI
jgi:hypothetical protein